jgi:septal ring factor EnvC (AmiA/AmiB activator)
MADEPDNLALKQLQAIRRDQAAMLEQIQTLARQMARIGETHVDVQRSVVEVQRAMGDIKVTISEMRSDIVQLEIHNLTRHNEILEILHRLDETEQQQGPANQALEQDPSSDPAAIHIDDQ